MGGERKRKTETFFLLSCRWRWSGWHLFPEINFGMMFGGRFVLGMGVGLEGGTVPVYVAESGMLPRFASIFGEARLLTDI